MPEASLYEEFLELQAAVEARRQEGAGSSAARPVSSFNMMERRRREKEQALQRMLRRQTKPSPVFSTSGRPKGGAASDTRHSRGRSANRPAHMRGRLAHPDKGIDFAARRNACVLGCPVQIQFTRSVQMAPSHA